MQQHNNTSKGAAATGVIAALAASSCCIPPLIAAIAGLGGASSSLSWMEPFRPYLIGLAVIAIGYSWYQYLKPKSEDDCGCSIDKPKFYQTKGFLIGMTLFAAISISIPYFSDAFFPDNKKEFTLTDTSQMKKITVAIEGMTCDACQSHVNHAVNELSGIKSVNSSYANANTVIEYDQSQTTIEELKTAINSTGYKAGAIQ